MSTLEEDIAFIRANKRFLTMWERVTFPLLAWLAIKFEPYRLRRLERDRQPVPGVYGPDQHAAGFVAKEVG